MLAPSLKANIWLTHPNVHLKETERQRARESCHNEKVCITLKFQDKSNQRKHTHTRAHAHTYTITVIS